MQALDLCLTGEAELTQGAHALLARLGVCHALAPLMLAGPGAPLLFGSLDLVYRSGPCTFKAVLGEADLRDPRSAEGGANAVCGCKEHMRLTSLSQGAQGSTLLGAEAWQCDLRACLPATAWLALTRTYALACSCSWHRCAETMQPVAPAAEP